MSLEKSPAEGLIGTILEGAYRIEGRLGEGGMATVYAATHLRLGKRVAVKVMTRELAANEEALARFHREAEVTSGLGHPHIVQVFDFSTTPAGEPFLVMEFLEGEDLDRRLQRVGRLPILSVVHIVKQVASALAATHAKSIVHRDLKPANIYLLDVAGENDFVKVVDFGISKVRSSSSKLTRTSALMGTPNYMSPEQANGAVTDVDERTDQWALACIAWECLAGEGPFSGENVPSTLFRVVHEPPPPLLPKVAGLHPQVEDVLLRALAKDKNDRFPTVSAFATALEDAVAGMALVAPQDLSRTAVFSVAVTSMISPRPTTLSSSTGEMEMAAVTPLSRPKWLWPAVAGAAVVVLFGGFLLLRPRSAPKQVLVSPQYVARPPTAPAPSEPKPAVAPSVDSGGQQEAKPEFQPALSKTIKEAKAENSQNTVDNKPKEDPAHDVSSQAKKRRVTKKSSQENQDIWRLD
jgi:serine/threonine-protein kinase